MMRHPKVTESLDDGATWRLGDIPFCVVYVRNYPFFTEDTLFIDTRLKRVIFCDRWLKDKSMNRPRDLGIIAQKYSGSAFVQLADVSKIWETRLGNEYASHHMLEGTRLEVFDGNTFVIRSAAIRYPPKVQLREPVVLARPLIYSAPDYSLLNRHKRLVRKAMAQRGLEDGLVRTHLYPFLFPF
jgi:hypothetical protein